MAKSFIPSPQSFSAAPHPVVPERESVQIIVIGSEAGITRIIHQLHQLNFAEVNEWSVMLPAPLPGKLMRTLIRYILLS